MPHILRDASGRIASVHRDPQPGSEAVPADHPELAELLGESATEAAFASLDATRAPVQVRLPERPAPRTL